MSRHTEQATLAYGDDELFAVVADVKHYPLFVPWCSGAHIRREDEREIIAELVIGFGPFQESFTSHVALNRPRQVLVRAIEGGPLDHLTNTWTFTPRGDKFMSISSLISSSKVICSITLPTGCSRRPQLA